MKKIACLIAALSFFAEAAWPTTVYAVEPDPMPTPSPQATLLCLAGKLQGQEGGPACIAYTSNFFSIWLPYTVSACEDAATRAARRAYLFSEWSEANSSLYEPVMQAFGGCVNMVDFPEPSPND